MCVLEFDRDRSSKVVGKFVGKPSVKAGPMGADVERLRGPWSAVARNLLSIYGAVGSVV